MRKVDIVCPVYNGEKYINKLVASINNQVNIEINKILFVLTESTDKTQEILDQLGMEYLTVKKHEFSHSKTREKAIIEYCDSEIVVMLSQDVELIGVNCLYELTKNIGKNKIAYTFGRQIGYHKDIEKYIREFNYPNKSYINDLNDIPSKQLKTFFSSDAFAAYDREVFIQVNGYDNKDIPVSEDMYYCHKIIQNGYKTEYSSDAQVFHSHDLKLDELFERYVKIGYFFYLNPELKKYKKGESSIRLALSIFFKSLRDLNLRVLFTFLPNLAVRYFGFKRGFKGKHE